MKKFRLPVLAIIFCLTCLIFTACSGRSSDADKSSSASVGQKDKYTGKAQDVITLFNEEKSDEIRDLCDEAMKNALSDDKLTEIYTQLKANGEFEKFLESDMTEVEQNGQTFTVVVQQAKYENNTLTFTLSFVKDDQLAGIFYK